MIINVDWVMKFPAWVFKISMQYEKFILSTQTDKKNGILALFRCKMAFLKWTWWPIQYIGVQKRTVSHLKGLE